MNEPDFRGIHEMLAGMSMKDLKPIRKLFGGSLGGASGKAATIDAMTSQLEYWWRFSNREAAEDAIGAIREAWRSRYG